MYFLSPLVCLDSVVSSFSFSLFGGLRSLIVELSGNLFIHLFF